MGVCTLFFSLMIAEQQNPARSAGRVNRIV
jgi:hypothetical protein